MANLVMQFSLFSYHITSLSLSISLSLCDAQILCSLRYSQTPSIGIASITIEFS